MQQASLLSMGLAPLRVNERVLVIAEQWEGVVAQVWDEGARYTVFAKEIPGRSIWKPLPIYARDELQALPYDREALDRIWCTHWDGPSQLPFFQPFRSKRMLAVEI